MTKDRMPDLQLANRQAGGSTRISIQSRKYSGLNNYLDEILIIRSKIESLEVKTKETQELHAKLLASTSPTSDFKKKIDEHTLKVQQEILEIRRNIKTLEESEALSSPNEATNSNTHSRIRATQMAAINSLFIEAAERHANVLLEFHERCSARMKQQLRIVNRNSTDPETLYLLESGEMALFVDNYILENREAQLALADAEERCKHLHQVEKRLYEIRDLFVELGVLIETQGALIDQIRFYSEHTEIQIGRAQESLWKTLKHKAKARQKKILIFVIIFLILIILILICFI